jgi:hypothetical protein
MRWVWALAGVVGLAAVGVGVLWILQGSDVLHLNPVLCAADCRPVTGHQPAWQVAGAVTAALGVGAVVLAVRKVFPSSR